MTQRRFDRPTNRLRGRQTEDKSHRHMILAPLHRRVPRTPPPSKAELRKMLADAVVETARRDRGSR